MALSNLVQTVASVLTGSASLRSEQLQRIRQLWGGHRIVFQVGSKNGTIRLASSRAAINDFKQWAGLTQQPLLNYSYKEIDA